MNKSTYQEEEMINRDSKIDYGVLLPVFLLCLIGLMSVYVALNHDVSNPEIMPAMIKQGLWYLLGSIAVVLIMHIKSKWLWKATPVFYGVGLLIMGLLLKFYDKNLYAATGSKNWFIIGGFSFQPSELMKIAYILMLALIVTSHNVGVKRRSIQTDLILIGKLLLVTLPVLVLIALQKDFGTMLVFLAIFGGVYLMSGISWKIVIPTVILVAAVGVGALYLVTTDSGREILTKFGAQAYQFRRIDAWLDPFGDTQGGSYQLYYGLLAIGSGGMFGKGFNVSDVYVPVRESDMIFTVIGENFGFIGGVFVILLYFVLIYRMIRVCFDMNNEFYTYIATGIIMMILFHVFENIGANIGLLPLTGIPLPFISQGGSSILGNMIGIGLIMSMSYQSAD
ncbi:MULTISPECIES: FtsW/RodA/SpoVE family cell cycle protein [unclassified Enterococcus]|uniref:FtsW/RodA/SpoVE family cell cycle protein n=1 Tax=unclassified Enterococcus TaxID=2608891 RepID=UPI002477192B|nr:MULTISPECIES: FtsW/RodA/SpoVE family cell cycle protein [unclassified Enterococcus]